MSSDIENYRLALSLQKQGRYKDAIATAFKISKPALRAGILIDSGFYSRKPQIVREGLALFEAILDGGHNKISRASLLYNIGNGYSSIYELRRLKGTRVIPPNDDDLRKAKKAYREALVEIRGNPSSLRSQILVNYGNCLSKLGRSFEAIRFYNEALELEPQNGMAAGNLGIELDRVAAITGRYAHHYLLAAYEALTKAFSSKMHLSYGGMEASHEFRQTLKRLKAVIESHKVDLKPLKQIIPSKRKATIGRYIHFCLKHHLFLNAWIGNQTVTPAISDEIAFSPITTSISDRETVPELLRVLNEIKEAFATARYLLYLAQTKSKVLDEISSITSYFDADSVDLHGLYLGLCKSAYTRSFDVLDKVARIVNIYFKIGKRTDYFWHIFAEKQSRGESHEIRYVARPAIASTHNYSLYALSDLCIDYFESEQVDFKTIDVRRNLMTHDYLAIIRKSSQSANANEVPVDELYRQAMAVLHLAKYAILYAVSAVYVSEKQKKTSRRTVSIQYKWTPGHTSRVIREGKKRQDTARS